MGKTEQLEVNIPAYNYLPKNFLSISINRRKALEIITLGGLSLLSAACNISLADQNIASNIESIPLPLPQTPLAETDETPISYIPISPSPTPTFTLVPTQTAIPSQTPVLEITPLVDNKRSVQVTPTPPSEAEVKLLKDQFIWRGNPDKANIALTFDDGWSMQQVKAMIDIVKDTKKKFTVFPYGKAIEAFPALWKQLYDLGCEFGCHTYSHPLNFAQLSLDEMIKEITKSQEALDYALGEHVPYQYIRPVGGTMSWNEVEAFKKTNLKGVIWTLSSFGTSDIATPKTVEERIVSLSGNGYINLEHFISNDVLALRNIIIGLRKKGLSPVTLSEVL